MATKPPTRDDGLFESPIFSGDFPIEILPQLQPPYRCSRSPGRVAGVPKARFNARAAKKLNSNLSIVQPRVDMRIFHFNRMGPTIIMILLFILWEINYAYNLRYVIWLLLNQAGHIDFSYLANQWLILNPSFHRKWTNKSVNWTHHILRNWNPWKQENGVFAQSISSNQIPVRYIMIGLDT